MWPSACTSATRRWKEFDPRSMAATRIGAHARRGTDPAPSHAAQAGEGTRDREHVALVLDVREQGLAVGREVHAGELAAAHRVAREHERRTVDHRHEVLGTDAVLRDHEPAPRVDGDV